MDFAFILDPLPELKAYKDSSVAMMRSLAARGHAVYALQQSDIFWDSHGTQARVAPLALKPGDHDWYEVGATEDRALKDFANRFSILAVPGIAEKRQFPVLDPPVRNQ